MRTSVGSVAAVTLLAAVWTTTGGCSANSAPPSGRVGTSGGTGGTGAADAAGGVGGSFDGGGTGGVGGSSLFEGGVDSGTGGVPAEDPKTCEEAAALKSYVGCSYWPTTVANNVWSIFDFAVVVANAGDQPADITVTRGASMISTTTVAPNGAATIYLPWVPELKGPDADACGTAVAPDASVFAREGAYHLESSVPVTAYQFNALQFRGQGGPPGKDWSSCPGNFPCPRDGLPYGCNSFTNDASLLLPDTAMTGNYRVVSRNGTRFMPPYIAITATEDGTDVTVTVSANGDVIPSLPVSAPCDGGAPTDSGATEAGAGDASTAEAGTPDATAGCEGGATTIEIGTTPPGGRLELSMNAGDVVQLVASIGGSVDLSGSLVQATKPVQVIAGLPCTSMPDTPGNTCDHVEEVVFPAETLGKRYFVVPPTAPNAQVVGHVVRLFGNVDGTQLTYPAGAPGGAPTTLNAGQVIDFGNVTTPLEIVGDKEFAVGSFMLSAQLLDPLGGLFAPRQGDPSASIVAAEEQYRTKYVFLAPNDYTQNYVDIVMPTGAAVVLDGTPVTGGAPIGASGFSAVRVKLGPGANGAHVLTSNRAVGIQVIGYGDYTSYQYPGGLNLEPIAPPPPPPPT